MSTNYNATNLIVLPNSKTISIEGMNFKLNVHYDQLSEKDLHMIEKYVNYIFHAYEEKYPLDVDADYTFDCYIYNSVEDYNNEHPWTRGKAGEHMEPKDLSQHFPHYEGDYFEETLAHKICHSLNYYNAKNYGISKPKCGHAGHDDASHFGWDSRKSLEAIRNNQEEKEAAEKFEQKGIEEYGVEKYGVEKYQENESNRTIEFQYKGVKYSVNKEGWKNILKDLSVEDRHQMIQEIKSSHELLVNKYHRSWETPPDKDSSILVEVAEDKSMNIYYYQNANSFSSGIDPYDAFVRRKISENKEIEDEETSSTSSFEDTFKQEDVEQYWECYWGFVFEYRGVTYEVRNKNLSEEEYQIIQDVKNSHESFMSEYYKSFGRQSSKTYATIDSDKNVERIMLFDYFGGDSYISLDTTLINRNKSESIDSYRSEKTEKNGLQADQTTKIAEKQGKLALNNGAKDIIKESSSKFS